MDVHRISLSSCLFHDRKSVAKGRRLHNDVSNGTVRDSLPLPVGLLGQDPDQWNSLARICFLVNVNWSIAG